MLSDLRYRAYDLLTGEYLTDLPMTGVEFSGTLNAAGSLSGVIPMTDPAVRALDPVGATTPGKRMIVVEYEGEIIDGYIIFPRNRKKTASAIRISGAQSTYAYLSKRVQATDYSAPPDSPLASPMPLWAAQSWDATLIAAQLLTDVFAYFKFGTAHPNCAILGGLTILINGLPPNASSPVVPSEFYTAQTFPYSSQQTLDSIMQQLTGLGWETGFDIRFDLEYSGAPGSTLLGVVNIGYPRLGQLQPDGITISGKKARDIEVDEDATGQGVVIYETGAIGAMVIEDNLDPLEQGWPVLEQVMSRSQIASSDPIAVLQAIGQEDSYLAAFPPTTMTVTAPLFGDEPQLGQFKVGDDARVMDDPSDVFPTGIDVWYRIVGYHATVNPAGDSTMDISLNIPPAASASQPAFDG